MKWKTYISPEEWGYNLLAIMALIMPLNKRMMPVFIALAVVFGVYKWAREGFKINHWKEKLRTGKALWILALFYLLHVIGFAFSENPDLAMKELEYKLSFLVFPLLFILIPKLSERRFKSLHEIFAFSCLLFIIGSVSYGIYRSVIHDSWAYLSYEKLGAIFHPTYMSAYQGLALFHLLRRGVGGDYLLAKRGVHVAAVSIIVIYIAMLASKAGLITTAGILIYFLFCHRVPGLPLRRSLWMTVPLLLLLLASSYLVPATSKRISAAAHSGAAAPVDTNFEGAKSSSALRKAVWSASIKVIGQHPFGVGTGDAQEVLSAEYVGRGELYAAKRKLNAHNQYLQVGVEFGWAGLIVLVAFLFVFLVQTWGVAEAMVFVGLVAFHCLLESFLEVQAGIVFLSFWMLVYLKRQV